MGKTMKVLDIHNGPIRYHCIKQLDVSINPYRLYRLEWREGRWHKKQIARYQDFQSVVWHVYNIAMNQHWE